MVIFRVYSWGARRITTAERTVVSRIYSITLAWVLLLLGLAGLLLPVLPGVPLLIAALFLLSRHYGWARRLLAHIRQSFPRVSAKAQQLWRNVNRKYVPHS